MGIVIASPPSRPPRGPALRPAGPAISTAPITDQWVPKAHTRTRTVLPL